MTAFSLTEVLFERRYVIDFPVRCSAESRASGGNELSIKGEGEKLVLMGFSGTIFFLSFLARLQDVDVEKIVEQ